MLYINGSNSSSAISVAANGTLGGSGTASATATINNSGNIAAGYAGVGTLTLAGLTLNTTTVNINSIQNYTSVPAIDVTGNNTLTTGGAVNSISFRFTGVGFTNTVPQIAHLIAYNGTVQGLNGIRAFNSSISLANLTNRSQRASATLITTDPGYIDLKFFTDYPVWSGAAGGVWATSRRYDGVRVDQLGFGEQRGRQHKLYPERQRGFQRQRERILP